MPKVKKILTEDELYSKYSSRCSVAEYCAFDIELKIRKEGASQEVAEKVVDKLIDEDFINEQRYIKAFVHDKFEFNHWGKIKIALALKQKRLSGSEVQNALEDIDDKKYYEVLTELISTKSRQIKADTNRERFHKLLSFAVSRGFETTLAYDIVSRFANDEDEE